MLALTLSVLVLAYLLGSFPTAYISERIVCGKDIRHMGDGNIRAQNAFRLFGARIGITVGLIDFIKGVMAVLLAWLANMSVPVILLSGMLFVAGHNWPVLLHVRVGRGEATTIGVLLLLVTWPMLIAGLVSLLTMLKTKNVTLASVPLFVLLQF